MKTVLTRRKFLGTAAAMAVSAPHVARAAMTNGFEIGLVADAQYADIEPHGTRYYRAGLTRLEDAVEHFNGRDLAFCAHLGDLIDREWKSFDAMMKPLGRSRHAWHQLLGNHDFEVLDEMKPKVPGRLGMRARYGTFVQGEIQFVVLDTNDVSTYAHRAGTAERAAAEAELKLQKAAKRRQAQTWNGAIGPAQLSWFERTCAAARAGRKRVIVLAHHPIAPAGAHNIWNADALLAALDRNPNVVAWLNGHNHAGAFAEHKGVPCLTMRGMVETANTTGFATAKILPDRIVLTGHGREPSREMLFRKA
ncbi:MAG: metallophosphoesterase [Opitutaceae bacterium]|nr:metallophosphoesterase [Opitutaceae bacterium]